MQVRLRAEPADADGVPSALALGSGRKTDDGKPDLLSSCLILSGLWYYVLKMNIDCGYDKAS